MYETFMKALRDILQTKLRPLVGLLPKRVQPLHMPARVTPQRAILRRAPVDISDDLAQTLLQISCPDPTTEDKLRDGHIAMGQRLARQERWGELSALIRKSDIGRNMTPGAMPAADLLAYGARADVVLAVEHALFDGSPPSDAPLLAGIEALEHVLAEHEGDPVISSIVAQSHMDIGWAWRGTGWDAEIPDRNHAAFAAHFDRAGDILSPFCPNTLQSPLLAASCCALLGGTDAGRRRVADRYEALIDLNPQNPRPMRAMGNHLLPRWYGSYKELELEAHRTAARVMETWGAGGYTWVMFDAISFDDEACANLDLTFFIEGLRDILARHSDPYTVNLLASYCANAIGQVYSGDDRADHNRKVIAGCARWIIRDHMTELHPMVWAHAAQGFDNSLHVRSPANFADSGRKDAMRIITRLFSREIAAGKRVVFTESGPEAMAGGA
ncbi:hypothetical protein [Sulfitobacter aestuariivivens]|uniref:hypothetical protein n=1 Tax=Sulfitobacter aestuariivivens TaxID=2766981 RepID=UPI00360A06FE